jgi:hypothetical protein
LRTIAGQICSIQLAVNSLAAYYTPEFRWTRYSRRLLELGRDEELLLSGIVLDPKKVWFTADLAILDVVLAVSAGFIHAGNVPFATACALESGFHNRIVATCDPRFRFSMTRS